MNRTNVIKYIVTSFLICSSFNSYGQNDHIKGDTIYILFQHLDKNKVDSTRMRVGIDCYENYPADYDRFFYISNTSVRLNYFVNPPDWSDVPFVYKEIDTTYLSEKDFKNQDWFRKASKHEIHNAFSGKNKVIFLVEEDRIKKDKAYMIRVYVQKFVIE